MPKIEVLLQARRHSTSRRVRRRILTMRQRIMKKMRG
jgi:hypothetical protein